MNTETLDTLIKHLQSIKFKRDLTAGKIISPFGSSVELENSNTSKSPSPQRTANLKKKLKVVTSHVAPPKTGQQSSLVSSVRKKRMQPLVFRGAAGTEKKPDATRRRKLLEQVPSPPRNPGFQKRDFSRQASQGVITGIKKQSTAPSSNKSAQPKPAPFRRVASTISSFTTNSVNNAPDVLNSARMFRANSGDRIRSLEREKAQIDYLNSPLIQRFN